MKIKTKILTGMISVALCIVLVFATLAATKLTSGSPQADARTREISLQSGAIDAQSVFAEYSDAKLTVSDNVTSFTGKRKIDKKRFTEIDYISSGNSDYLENIEIGYAVSFDAETANVFLEASLGGEILLIDGIEGIGLPNGDGTNEILFLMGDEIVSSTDLMQLNGLDEVGIFDFFLNIGKKIVEKISDFFKSFVRNTLQFAVNVIIDSFVNCAALGLSVIDVVTNIFTFQAIHSNYEHNIKQKVYIEDVDFEQRGYITHQRLFSEWKCGKSFNIAQMGCGAIATYNVLRRFGKINNYSSDEGNSEAFAGIIRNYEVACGMNIGGFFGINPLHFAPQIRKQGLNIDVYQTAMQWKFEEECNSLGGGAAVVCYFYSDKRGTAMHYATLIKNSSGKLIFINDSLSEVSDIREFTSKYKIFYGWIIKN